MCEELSQKGTLKGNPMDTEVVRQDNSGALYYDLPINSSCIRKMILGPEFSSEDYRKTGKKTPSDAI